MIVGTLAEFATMSMMECMDGTEVGARIRERRESAGVSQAQLGRVLGVSGSLVSRIESGERKVTVFDLGLLSDAYGWDVRDLLGIERPRVKMELAARLRAAAGDVVDGSRRAAALIEVDALLDDLGLDDRSSGLRFVRTMPPPTSPEDAQRQGEGLAADLRAWAGLRGPVADLFAFVENVLGIDVSAQPLDGDCDGVVVVGQDLAVAVIDSGVIAPRGRFTVCHEACHVICCDVLDSVRFEVEAQDVLVEQRADSFAAAFLMPADEMRAALGPRPSAVDLACVLVTYRVSWKALKRRCVGLDIAIDEDLTDLDGAGLFDRAGRRDDLAALEAEDRRGSIRMPARIARRIRSAYVDGRIGAAVVGSAYDVNDEDLDRLLERMPLAFQVPVPSTRAMRAQVGERGSRVAATSA